MLNCGKFSNGHPFCHASPDGDAKCECLPGYKKINDNSCIDIDECDHPDPYRNDSYLNFRANRVLTVESTVSSELPVQNTDSQKNES